MRWIEEVSGLPGAPAPTRSLPLGWPCAGLRERGVDARLEFFASYDTFAKPYGLLIALALAAGAMPRRRRRLRTLLALSAAIGASLEGELRRVSPGALFARRTSQNLVAEMPPVAGEEQTLSCFRISTPREAA